MKTAQYIVSISDTETTSDKIGQCLVSAGLVESEDFRSRLIPCRKFPVSFIRMSAREAVDKILYGRISGCIEEIADITEVLSGIGWWYALNDEKDGIVQYVRDGELRFPVKFWFDNEEPLKKETILSTGPKLEESYPVGWFDERILESDTILTRIVDDIAELLSASYYDSPKYRNMYPRG